MNKELLNQLSTDEQYIAAEINSAAEAMKPSAGFQWELEDRLMDAANRKTGHTTGWQKIIPALGWAILAGCAVFLLNWTIRSLASNPPEVGTGIPDPQVSFLSNIQQGNICLGTLALEHGFSVFLTNPDKTEFVALDAGRTIGELRSFTWSADGKQLAIVGNTAGTGNIYITNPAGGKLDYVLSSSELGYMMDAAWSRDGKQFVMWSSQNITTLYLLNADGTGLLEKQLDVHILGTPQFSPNGKSVIFYGGDTASTGLFEMNLESSQVTLINPLVEDASGFAFSPDGSLLAYMEYDRDEGEARLLTADLATDERNVLGTLSISKDSGASSSDSTNLSWSADAKSLVFDFGRGAYDRVIYLAHAGGTGLEVVAAGSAPAVSSDGKCLAYINNKQVFLMDLTTASVPSSTTTPVLLADLPEGRGTSYSQLNRLQWQP